MLETLYQVINFILYFLLLEFNIIFLASYFKYDAGSKFKKKCFHFHTHKCQLPIVILKRV